MSALMFNPAAQVCEGRAECGDIVYDHNTPARRDLAEKGGLSQNPGGCIRSGVGHLVRLGNAQENFGA
jgi:hypothetical protein